MFYSKQARHLPSSPCRIALSMATGQVKAYPSCTVSSQQNYTKIWKKIIFLRWYKLQPKKVAAWKVWKNSNTPKSATARFENYILFTLFFRSLFFLIKKEIIIVFPTTPTNDRVKPTVSKKIEKKIHVFLLIKSLCQLQ